MTRTHLILDGLQDPRVGQELSHQWAVAGFENAVDVSGQAAWVVIPPTSTPSPFQGKGRGEGETVQVPEHARIGAPTNQSVSPLTQPLPVRLSSPKSPEGRGAGSVAAIARHFGLEIRDRVGSTFKPDNDLGELRARLVYEYKSRFATVLLFGLPALALHYLGPRLTDGKNPRSMLLPWLIEFLLVGWMCLAAGWPVLWQGGLALIHLRATADLLTSAIILAAFAYSIIGWLSVLIGDATWFIAPMFHVANLAVMIAVLQRWLAHRYAERIAGRANWIIPGFGRIVFLWLLACVAFTILRDWQTGFALALTFPPLIGLGAINRLTPGPSALLPLPAFALLLLLGPDAFSLQVHNRLIEIAAGFAIIMTITMALGWRNLTPTLNG